MEITRNHIGEVICLYPTAECVRIQDVSDRYVFYEKEFGSSYATYAHTADGFCITDPARLEIFDSNCRLGKVLLNAELAAMEDLLSNSNTDEEIMMASASLEKTHRHQHVLHERIDTQRNTWSAGQNIADKYLQERLNGKGSEIFWGRKVELLHATDGTDLFRIDGRTFYPAHAAKYLSSVQYHEPERKLALDAQIRTAGSRRQRNPLAFETAHTYLSER